MNQNSGFRVYFTVLQLSKNIRQKKRGSIANLWGKTFFLDRKKFVFSIAHTEKISWRKLGKRRFTFWWDDPMSYFILLIQKFLFWFTVPSLLRLRPIEASFCPKNDVPCTKGIKRMASICALPSWQINLKSLLCLQNLFSSRLCQTTKSWLFKFVVEAGVF